MELTAIWPFDIFLKLTASSRPSAPPSDSPKCLRFGHWLTLCSGLHSKYSFAYLLAKHSSITVRPQFLFQVIGGVSNLKWGREGGPAEVEILPLESWLASSYRFSILSFSACVLCCRAVTDPRNGRRVAIKKLPNVFHSLVSCKRVYRELKMLCTFQHENVRDTYIPPHP